MPLITTTSSAAAKGLGFSGQTGAARTSPIGGYHVWLDAADASTFTYSSGTVVSRWTDKSPNAFAFEPNSTGTAPSRSGTQNSKSTIVFDGSNDGLAATGSNANWRFLHDGTPCTVFVVFKYTGTWTNGTYKDMTILETQKYAFPSLNSGYPGFEFDLSASMFNTQQFFGSYTSVFTGVKQSGQTYPAYLYAQMPYNVNNNWMVSSIFLDPNNSPDSNKMVHYSTNDSFPSFPSSGSTVYGWVGPNSTTDPLGTLSIGKVNDSTNGFDALQGQIAEIIIYKSRLSVADKTSMENYFKNKWNIA